MSVGSRTHSPHLYENFKRNPTYLYYAFAGFPWCLNLLGKYSKRVQSLLHFFKVQKNCFWIRIFFGLFLFLFFAILFESLFSIKTKQKRLLLKFYSNEHRIMNACKKTKRERERNFILFIFKK
jgi:hypothetical protein